MLLTCDVHGGVPAPGEAVDVVGLAPVHAGVILLAGRKEEQRAIRQLDPRILIITLEKEFI